MPKASLVALAVVVVIFALLSFVLSGRKEQPSSTSKPATSGFNVVTADQKDSVARTIKTTFTSSTHKDIITFVNLAAAEKDKATQYSYYTKAYAKMLTFYNAEKDSKMKQALLDLKTYAKTFPQYKESDFSTTQ